MSQNSWKHYFKFLFTAYVHVQNLAIDARNFGLRLLRASAFFFYVWIFSLGIQRIFEAVTVVSLLFSWPEWARNAKKKDLNYYTLSKCKAALAISNIQLWRTQLLRCYFIDTCFSRGQHSAHTALCQYGKAPNHMSSIPHKDGMLFIFKKFFLSLLSWQTLSNIGGTGIINDSIKGKHNVIIFHPLQE